MTALMTVVSFFYVLLVIYPAAAAMVAFYGWVKKRRALRHNDTGSTTLLQIDEATDRLKNRWFTISIVLAFFVIAPFLVFLMIFRK